MFTSVATQVLYHRSQRPFSFSKLDLFLFAAALLIGWLLWTSRGEGSTLGTRGRSVGAFVGMCMVLLFSVHRNCNSCLAYINPQGFHRLTLDGETFHVGYTGRKGTITLPRTQLNRILISRSKARLTRTNGRRRRTLPSYHIELHTTEGTILRSLPGFRFRFFDTQKKLKQQLPASWHIPVSFQDKLPPNTND